MNVDTMIAESLLENGVVTLRGVHALLAFWRAWRHVIPREAAITDDELREIERAGQHGPICYDAATGTFSTGPQPDISADLAAFHRCRAIWLRISTILDLPDEQAVDTLYALVNGPDALDIAPLFITLGFSTAPRDPIYTDYLRHVYRPYQRHVEHRLRGQSLTRSPQSSALSHTPRTVATPGSRPPPDRASTAACPSRPR